MNQGELMNCAVCIVVGFLLYSFIQNGFCGKNLVEGFKPRLSDCSQSKDCNNKWYEFGNNGDIQCAACEEGGFKCVDYGESC